MMSSGKTILFSIFHVVTNILISCTLLTGAEHTCEISLNQSTGLIDVTQTDYKNLYCDWKIGNFGITDAVALFLFDQTAIVSCSEYVKIFSGDGTLVYHKEGCCPNDPGSFIEIPFMQSENIKVNILLTELQSRITSHFVILRHGLHSATYTPGWLASVDNITSSSILIQWNNLTSFINRELLHYIVLLSSSDGSPPYHANVDGSRLYIEIYGLDHSQRYHMEVFGVDALGYCYKTLEVNATTKKVSCGYRPSGMRIVGGSVAPINSWPWQAMLRNSYGWQFCGGSLIHPFWVVTAAHCVHGKSASSVKVLLGAHYKSYGNVSTEQNFDVIKIIEHESYNSPYRWSNDIALLRLSKPAKLGKGVGLVCPPDTSFKLPFDSPNKKCWITGWGRLSYNGTYPNELMQVDLPLVSKKRCITSYPDKIDDSMICVGQDEGGIGGCSGDSGGPLVCEFSGKWYLEGATSWGSKRCADPLKYTVYANIRHLKSWITSKMSSFPVTAFYLSCNFDKSLCSGWEQSYSDAFDWTRHRGSTPSLSTGPSYDHTSGSGYYMYIEASSPRVMGDKAKLELSLCGNGDEACLTFYYHMYGNTTGTLNVFSGSKVVFSASGNKGNYWQKAERTIYLDKVVTFEGIVGSSFKGDIAIDDVSIKSGRCLTSPATTTCNFDSRLCSGWLQSYSDVFDWTRNRGATTSSNTGPDYDHTTGFGYYMYIEATKKNAGDNAKLKLYLNGNGEVSCLRFYYHMYGDTIGALNVYSENHLIFNSIGNHGNFWIKAERTFHSDTTLTFEGIVGYSFTGDIAIDDVTVSSGSCSGQTPPPTWHSALTTIEPSLKPNSSNNVTTQKPSMPVDSPTSKGNFTSTHVLTYNPTTIPRTPSAKEIQEAVMLKMTNFDMKKWKEMEADFKREVASAANEYCADGGASCQTSLRRRRSSDSMKNLIGNPQFSDDMVQIVSGYPRLSPDDPSITLLAFYLQLPGGVGDNLVSEDVLKNIVKSDIKSIEGSMGVSITTVQSMPSTKNEVDQEDETDDKGSISTSVIVGVTLGSLSLLGILIAVNLFIKSNRFGPKRRALSTDKVNQGIELDQDAVNKNADKHGVTSSKPSGTTIAGVSVEETSLDEEYHEEKLPRPGEEIPPNENVNC